jgi:hypothetical protein
VPKPVELVVLRREKTPGAGGGGDQSVEKLHRSGPKRFGVPTIPGGSPEHSNQAPLAGRERIAATALNRQRSSKARFGETEGASECGR